MCLACTNAGEGGTQKGFKVEGFHLLQAEDDLIWPYVMVEVAAYVLTNLAKCLRATTGLIKNPAQKLQLSRTAWISTGRFTSQFSCSLYRLDDG